MAKKYKHPRMPIEAWEGFNRKKTVLEQMAKENNMKAKVNFTDVLKFFSQKQTIVYPEELTSYFNNRKIKRKMRWTTI
jgi:hypothetical protein